MGIKILLLLFDKLSVSLSYLGIKLSEVKVKVNVFEEQEIY